MKKLLIFTVVMFGFGFALVPFYEKICEVTGINNLLQADTLADEYPGRYRALGNGGAGCKYTGTALAVQASPVNYSCASWGTGSGDVRS